MGQKILKNPKTMKAENDASESENEEEIKKGNEKENGPKHSEEY